MGLLDFFKSKKKIEEPPKEIGISEAYILLEEELNKENEKAEEVKKRVSEKIEEFISNLDAQIKILNLIDLKSSREHESIKLTTLQGLEEYIEQLNNLVENLKEIDKATEFHQYIQKIDIAMDVFFRNSRKKLQKATILIGKELAQTEEIIKMFHREISKIVRKDIKITSKTARIKKLQTLKDLCCKAKETNEKISDIILCLEKEKKEIVTKKSEGEKKLDLFKSSEECKCWLEEKESLGKEKQMLDEDIRQLKEKIDFKLLLNKFHSIPKYLELLKNYRDDFLNTLINDEKFRILDMIEGDRKNFIERELKAIFKKYQHLEEKESCYKINQKEKDFKDELQKADYQIEVLNEKVKRENKKLKRFIEKEKEFQKEEIERIENILENIRIVDGV